VLLLRSQRCADIQAQLRESTDESEVGDAPNAKLVLHMQQDAVSRKVALAYVVQRLMEADLASAKTVLVAAKEASGALSSHRFLTAASVQALSDALLRDEGAGLPHSAFISVAHFVSRRPLCSHARSSACNSRELAQALPRHWHLGGSGGRPALASRSHFDRGS
jgi:hypothetical protein